MCLQDIAIGRRTASRRHRILTDDTIQLALAADARRVGLAVVVSNQPIEFYLGFGLVDDVICRVWGVINNATTNLAKITEISRFFSIKDYGIELAGEVYVQGGDGGYCFVTEYYTLPDLDIAVQKEVKRAF
jgi:hypothetical protein